MQRERFDALLADPRHHRGDFRMVRAALREGRLDSLTDAEGEALVAKLCEVGLSNVNKEGDSTPTGYRAFFNFTWLLLDLERENQKGFWQAQGQMLPGRPRSRHALQTRGRLDARSIRRDLQQHGLAGRVFELPVKCDQQQFLVSLIWRPDRTYGQRLYLVCAGCGKPRVHLYASQHGPRCRSCCGLVYRRDRPHPS